MCLLWKPTQGQTQLQLMPDTENLWAWFHKRTRSSSQASAAPSAPRDHLPQLPCILSQVSTHCYSEGHQPTLQVPLLRGWKAMTERHIVPICPQRLLPPYFHIRLSFLTGKPCNFSFLIPDSKAATIYKTLSQFSQLWNFNAIAKPLIYIIYRILLPRLNSDVII